MGLCIYYSDNTILLPGAASQEPANFTTIAGTLPVSDIKL